MKTTFTCKHCNGVVQGCTVIIESVIKLDNLFPPQFTCPMRLEDANFEKTSDEVKQP